jgi:hypothetical protein
MQWPHWLTIWKANPDAKPGTQDKDTGIWVSTSQPRITLYDGNADVQESPRRRGRDQNGEPSVAADAVAFLADEWVLQGRNGSQGVLTDTTDGTLTEDGTNQTIQASGPVIPVDDDCFATITWPEGAQSDARILGVRRLDGAVLLKHV